MKLLALRLINFRQFLGEQQLEFAIDPERNVTIAFGANGAGKTTLLNAFTWVLYGELSDDVEEKHRLVNDHLWATTPFGEPVKVAVELDFEHEETEYHARREIQAIKNSEQQRLPEPLLRLWLRGPDGGLEEIHAAQDRLDAVLPRQLSGFFFFNGERIEHLVRRGAYAEIKQAIKTLLGLKQVERALEHLPKAERKLSAELRRFANADVQRITQDLEDAREQQQADRKTREEADANVGRLRDELDDVDRILAEHQAAGSLQRERQTFSYQIKQAEGRRDQAEQTRNGIVAQEGFLAFVPRLIVQSRELATNLERRGELPAPLKREFVDGLLEAQQCICGTSLTPGTSPHEHVTQWRARAGLAEVESAWQHLSGALGLLEDQRDSMRKRLSEATQRMADETEEIRRLADQLSDVDRRLRGLPLEDVQRLEARRQELRQKISRQEREIGRLEQAIKDFDQRIAQLNSELHNAKIQDAQAEIARGRVQVASEVTDALRQILELRTESVRTELDRKIKDIFRRTTVKPYTPELSREFELELWQNVDGVTQPVPKSTGENQVLSLSFVGAVSELAREHAKQRAAGGGVMGAEGGSYPIVMDAAFGSLDENYRREVAQTLPSMAPQIVVLVSKGQGMGIVADELRPSIGRTEVITAYTSNQDKEPETIVIEGREHRYVVTRSDRDYAELLEVR